MANSKRRLRAAAQVVTTIEDNETVALVTALLGNNIFEVEVPTSEIQTRKSKAWMPPKFRNVVWVKTGPGLQQSAARSELAKVSTLL